METLSFMDLLVLTTAALLIISKFFDCYTTHKYIDRSRETNPIGARLMELLGEKTAIWAIFLFVLLLVSASAAYYFLFPSLFYGISFVILGAVVSTIQFAVAHFNYSFSKGKTVRNPLIKMTLLLHQRLKNVKLR
ncbi:hypothetical protein [Salinimicrobium soli]|uniref:hypothetical protein n=1 Tax=Salinimicrobium soli TaxID=1254399 RepID=UPI003AAD3098